MINSFLKLSSKDVENLLSFVESCTLGQNHRVNYLWRGERVHYVLDFLRSTGFVNINDLETLVSFFEDRKYRYSQRYHNDYLFARLCEGYHKRDSCFLPVVLKKIESTPGLSTLWGKLAPKKEFLKSKVYLDRIQSWLYTPKVLDFDLAKVRSTVKRLLGRLKIPQKPRLRNFAEFISLRTLWGTSGSTDVPVSKLYNKTKWQDALLLSDAELISIVNKSLSRGYPIYSIIPKQEPNTVRAVVLVDLVTYLIESYGSYYLDDMLSDHPVFFNWKSESERFKYWISVLDGIRKGNTYLDLDWSNWDANLNDEMYQIILDETVKVISPFCPDFEMFVPYLKSAVSGAVLRGFPGKTSNGLASGRRWTTYINSVLNAVFLILAGEQFGLDLLNTPNALVTLGDDSQTMLQVPHLAEYMFDWLNDRGASVNKSKSKITRDRPEFLKLTAQGLTVAGDQVRAVRSILWSTENETVKDARANPNLQTRADIWVKFISRVYQSSEKYFDTTLCSKTMLRDFSGKTRLPIGKLYRLVNTAQAYGGLGFSDQAKDKLGVEFISGERQRVVNLPLKVPKFYDKVFSSIQRLGQQTLIPQLKASDKNWKYVRKSVVRDMSKIDDNIQGKLVTVVTNRNLVPVDSSTPERLALDRLWLSQLTFDELNNYKSAGISSTLKGAISTLLSVWSKHIAYDELSSGSISSPPVPRSAIIAVGEVLCNYIWRFVWSTTLLPNKLRKLSTASYMHLVVVGQHLFDFIFVKQVSGFGALGLRRNPHLDAWEGTNIP